MKVTNLVTLRLAELINELVKQGLYRDDFMVLANEHKQVPWSTQLFRSFDSLIKVEETAMKASPEVSRVSHCYRSLI